MENKGSTNKKYSLEPSDFNSEKKPTWCIGCGNFAIWNSLKKAYVELELEPYQILMVFGIGNAGNGANFFKTYAFHSLHGMALPVATGARLANNRINIIVITGDGDGLGIGGNHFIHTCRRNLNITHILHDNRIYGLTTGQSSPTSRKGFKTKSTPEGTLETSLNPIMTALTCGATFVARGFSGDLKQLQEIMVRAIKHRGFAFVDVLQPCVTFNKIDTYDYFRQRVYKLEDIKGYDTGNYMKAIEKSLEGEKIATGVFYQVLRDTYEDGLEQIKEKPLYMRSIENINIDKLINTYY